MLTKFRAMRVCYTMIMDTIELSRKVRANQPLVIPAELLTQHIGSQAEIIVQFKLSHVPDQVGEADDNWDAEWDELIAKIKSTPTPSEYIKPATEPITQQFVDEFLAQDNNPDFDAKGE